ncbi:MAG: hypothetical protein JSV41_02505 [Gemmatimonadota bacterium]|nr:MAG: hypothetical protein JSV41_02505 [Gemmatimonadota bacterium]
MLMLRPRRLDDWGVGIVAVDRLPPPPQPTLRAFIWCRRDRSHDPLLNGSGRARPVPAWLMVGPVMPTPDVDATGGPEGNGRG